MKKDILGKAQLNSLKINFKSGIPGVMTTRCCATGTCENQPERKKYKHKSNMILFTPDSKSIEDITEHYGYLRM